MVFENGWKENIILRKKEKKKKKKKKEGEMCNS